MPMRMPAIKYRMGGRDFYDSCIAWGGLAKVVDFEQIGGPENRPLDRGHWKDIQYYVEEEDQPIFPALLLFASNGDFTFTPSEDFGDGVATGTLEIPDDVTLVVGDGQHRSVGLREVTRALETRERFRQNKIGITLVVEDRPDKRRLDWRDINDTVKAPNKAVALLFNERNPITRLYERLSREVAIFSGGELGFVEERKNSPGRSSIQLFAANNVGQAITAFILGSTRRGTSAAEKELSQRLKAEDSVRKVGNDLIEYFSSIEEHFPAMRALVTAGDRRVPEEVAAVREEFVWASGIGLNLLGLLGFHAAKNGWNLRKYGEVLAKLDWSRDDSFWHGHLIVPRQLEDGTVSYGVGRGGDVIDEAARRVLALVSEKMAA